jgi:hypothetical protein
MRRRDRQRCDGKPDDESNNACGGPCSTQLAHRPGEPCSNGLKGACQRSGTYQCEAVVIRCNAPNPNPGSEICGDQIDNDCDGSVDEADASDAPTWYQDCDNDGFAAATAGSVRACTKPAAQGTCSWTAVLPRPETHSNWDCNDSRAEYKPGAGYAIPSVLALGFDFDCDGQAVPDPSFMSSPQPCPRSIVDHFNRPEPRGDCPVTVDSNACFLWKDSAGRYQPAPTTSCPDAPFRVTFSPFDPCSVASSPAAAVWPCR